MYRVLVRDGLIVRRLQRLAELRAVGQLSVKERRLSTPRSALGRFNARRPLRDECLHCRLAVIERVPQQVLCSLCEQPELAGSGQHGDELLLLQRGRSRATPSVQQDQRGGDGGGSRDQGRRVPSTRDHVAKRARPTGGEEGT